MLDPSLRGKPFAVAGIVMYVTNQSFLLFDDASGLECWIPHSRVQNFEFSDGGMGHITSTKLLEPDDAVTVHIPMWLAAKEGLL